MERPQADSYPHPSPYGSGDASIGTRSAALAPVRGLEVGVLLGLCGWVALTLAYVGVVVWRHALLDSIVAGDRVNPEFLSANETAYQVSVLAQYGVSVVLALLFVIWLFRVRSNAEKISDRRHRWGKPWLVLTWFVPIANLWWPRQVVEDIWTASDLRFLNASTWRRPWLVWVWWTTWLLYLALDFLFVRISATSTGPDLRSQATMNEIMTDLVGVAAALLAIWVVWRLSGLQDRRGRELERLLAGCPSR
jgi:uncharacterized protein DUF4328